MVHKINIQTTKGIREMICKNPLGRHTKKALKMLIVAQSDEEHQAEKMGEYLDYLDEMSAELCDMSVEELDELDTDEKNKILEHYQDKVSTRLDFLKSSLGSDNSVPKEKQVQSK